MTAATESPPRLSGLDLPNPLLDSDDLAALFNVGAWTIRQWSSNGTIPAGRRIGKRLRWTPSQIVPLLPGA